MPAPKPTPQPVTGSKPDEMLPTAGGSPRLVASFLNGGMSPGAAVAFLITGAGTSIGSISGMLVIARWRIVTLIIGTLFVTAIATGWLAPLWL